VITDPSDPPSSVPSIGVVQLPDEVDLLTAPDVRDQLMVSLSRCPHLVVDASAVTFMDSTGINALVRAKDRAELLGGSLHVVATGRSVLRVLEVTHLVRLLGVVPTLAEAERCVSSPGTGHCCRRTVDG
jgi:anti-sigma B factor antagonist